MYVWFSTCMKLSLCKLSTKIRIVLCVYCSPQSGANEQMNVYVPINNDNNDYYASCSPVETFWRHESIISVLISFYNPDEKACKLETSWFKMSCASIKQSGIIVSYSSNGKASRIATTVHCAQSKFFLASTITHAVLLIFNFKMKATTMHIGMRIWSVIVFTVYCAMVHIVVVCTRARKMWWC